MGEEMALKRRGGLTCFTTVTVPGAMATTEATAVASWVSVPSSMICWRMFTAVGSSRSPGAEKQTGTIRPLGSTEALACSPWTGTL